MEATVAKVMHRCLISLLVVLVMSSFAVAGEVHPALQEAIDSKNYKQAENLIKNVGIKDVYCPETLAAKDADKIYGKVFAESIKSLLENCDAEFSRNYLDYKCAGGKDRTMCLNLVSLTDPFYWPDSYAKQFCTKKNVEFCAIAVERVSIEQSIPYLKAIKANKLADMKGNDNSIARAVLDCRERCELGRRSPESARQIIDDYIFKRKQEWRRATSLREQQEIEADIRRLEKQKVAIRFNDYCAKACPGSSLSKQELKNISQYYFEKAFYTLSHRVYLYYRDENNPIIPELAENWSIVDNLIESSLDFFMKSAKDDRYQEPSNTGIRLLDIILERRKTYPNVITKRFVMDTLKASFASGANIEDSEQLFYCKIYPSLEKEAEKFFGTNVLNCKLIIEENKKLHEPCHEGDLPLFEGKFQCEETLNGWEYVKTNNQKCEEADEGKCFDEYCCENSRLREGTDVELSVGKICSSSIQDSIFVFGESAYLCDKTDFVEIETTDERFLRTLISDSRDGKIYRKIKIGNQIWMAENLNYETNNSYCYEDNPTNCQKYGRLYEWKAAIDACPRGWHLPSEDEFDALSATVGGKSTAAKMLKSQTGWKHNGNGTDAYGFAALPAGFMSESDYYRNFMGEGVNACFWSVKQDPHVPPRAYYYVLGTGDDAKLKGGDGNDFYYVRCLKD